MTSTTKRAASPAKAKAAVQPSEAVNAAKRYKITDNTEICVTSMFSGKLRFTNSRTGESYIWSRRGEALDLTVSDIKDMRSKQVLFFDNQWVRIGDGVDEDGNTIPSHEIIKALRLEHYYKNFIDPDNFDELCSIKTEDIENRVSMLTDGAKENLTVALNDYIKSGRLDSISKVRAFEKALGCSLCDVS